MLRRLCRQRRLSARQRPGGQHAVQREPDQTPLLCDQPPDAPQAFFWTIAKPGEEPVPTTIEEWTESTDAAYREGRLAVRSHFYCASPTVFPEGYVNTFGVGAPLAGLPVYAVLDLFVDIEHDRFWWWHGAALTASLLTALFVFLTARGFVEPVPAALIALAFGLGSCAWPVSSEITKRDIPGSGGAAAGLRVPGCVPLVGSTDLGGDAARVDRPVEIDTGELGATSYHALRPKATRRPPSSTMTSPAGGFPRSQPHAGLPPL